MFSINMNFEHYGHCFLQYLAFSKGLFNNLMVVSLCLSIALAGYPGEEMESRRRDSRLIKNTKERGIGQQVKLENKSPMSEQQI